MTAIAHASPTLSGCADSGRAFSNSTGFVIDGIDLTGKVAMVAATVFTLFRTIGGAS